MRPSQTSISLGQWDQRLSDEIAHDYDPHNGGGLCLPPFQFVLRIKTNTIEKTIDVNGVIPGYEVENSKGQNYLHVYKEIVDILTATEEWKALPDYELVYY